MHAYCMSGLVCGSSCVRRKCVCVHVCMEVCVCIHNCASLCMFSASLRACVCFIARFYCVCVCAERVLKESKLL